MERRPDTADDWLLPEASRPPTVSEMMRRIDEAVERARSSEAAAISVGDAALDAAERARAAVEQAMLAAEQAHSSARLVDRLGAELRGRGEGGPELPAARLDRSAGSFAERADRVVARLQSIGRVPIGADGAHGPVRPASIG